MKNLSGIKGSMTYVLEHHLADLNTCKTVAELHDCINDLFKTNKIDTTASNRLLQNINKKRTYNDAILVVYNSILCGGSLGVIK